MITDKFCFIARLVLIGFNIPIFSGSGETWPAEWYFEQLQQQWHPRHAKPPQTRTAHYPGKPVRDRTSLEFCGGKCLGKNCYYGVFDDVIKMYITIILGTKKNNFFFLFSTNLLLWYISITKTIFKNLLLEHRNLSGFFIY